MSLAFVDRPPTSNELQKLRLVLSTYQDGTGQLAQQGDLTLPGWRNFERSVALVFGGKAQESKAVFDVLLPDQGKPGVSYGIWYGHSGGQLKYYPSASSAMWASDVFALEPIPVGAEYGVLQKAAAYFPALWESPSDG